MEQISGTFLQRKTSGGYVILGLVFFDDFKPVEGFQYAASLNANTTNILTRKPITTSLPTGYWESGIGYLLRDPIWAIGDGFMGVRFIPTELAGGYVLYCASPTPILATEESHVWVKARAGVVTGTSKPFGFETGEAVGQLFNAPVWPDLDGKLYGLRALPTRQLALWGELATLRIRVHLKELTQAGFKETVRRRPELDALSGTGFDVAYAEYLYLLREAGFLEHQRIAEPADYISRRDEGIRLILQRME